MVHNPTIRSQSCRRTCWTTWRYEYGASVPGGPFPGTMADRGDVRRCAHDHIWVATGRTLTSGFFTEHDEWDRLTWWGSPLRYFRATRVLSDPNPREENVTEVDGIRLVDVHDPERCAGRACVVHNQSDHHMRGWPLHWRNDRGIFERTCPHGVGHPDPDQFEYWAQARAAWRPPLSADVIDDPYPVDNPYDGIGVHSCDGCCRGDRP